MVCSCRVVQPRNASTEAQRVYAVISSDNGLASSERRLLRFLCQAASSLGAVQRMHWRHQALAGTVLTQPAPCQRHGRTLLSVPARS